MIKKPLIKSCKLKKLSLINIKNKKIKALLLFFFSIITMFFLWFSLNKYYVEESNIEINNVLINYFNTLNKKDFDNLNKYLYTDSNNINTDSQKVNEKYILMLKAKSEVINLQSIRLKKIYPALIDRNIAIVGYEISTESLYNNELTTLKEIKIQVMLKKNNNWFIAKPNDLNKYDKKYLNDFFDEYNNILKENIAPDSDNDLYNNSAFNKIIVKEKEQK